MVEIQCIKKRECVWERHNIGGGHTNTQVINAGKIGTESKKEEEAGTGEIFLFIWHSNGIGKELGIKFFREVRRACSEEELAVKCLLWYALHQKYKTTFSKKY